MLTAPHITQRMAEKRCNTDLGLIYDMWSANICAENTMRASDQNAVRKAVAAIDRVAHELTRFLTPSDDTTYRILPEINSTTRVRKAPERFWVEFSPRGSVQYGAPNAIVFVEFSTSEANFGIQLPTTSTAAEIDELSSLEHLKALDDGDLADWHIEQSRPPAENAACSSDLNTWLSGRIAAKQKNDLFLTLRKTYSDSRPLMAEITAGLAEASQLCDKINDQNMGWQHAASALTAEQSVALAQR